MSEKTENTDIKNPATHVVVTLFTEQNFTTRIGIAAIIILFLLFAYYLIGGYTNTCGCGSGESYQNCGCQSGYQRNHNHSHSYSHSHSHSHLHDTSSHGMSSNSNIYQMSPYF